MRKPATLHQRVPLYLIAILLIAILVSCSHETTFLDPATEEPDDGPQGIQRAALIVTVTLAGEDSALATRLGYTDGVLPGVELTIERSGPDANRQTGLTDDSGQVRFEHLLEGFWAISFVRILTPEESARFDEADSDVNAFGGGTVVRLEAPAEEVELAAVAGRRGSLVISELHAARPRNPAGGSYQWGQYVEFYNNADSAVSLAGKTVALGMPQVRDHSSPLSCDELSTWRLDPEGIWTARHVWAFPGSAGSLEPGHSIVLAMDAIDHRGFDSGLQDLSEADFEFIGHADVDNPGVPNMIRLGKVVGSGVPQLGHGPRLAVSDAVIIVAEEVDVSSLVRDNLPVTDPEYWRIPEDKILDVLTAGPTPAREASSLFPRCDSYTHPKFDRGEVSAIDLEALNSIKRVILATLPDGRSVLQRTKTSARDFRGGVPTPGRVP